MFKRNSIRTKIYPVSKTSYKNYFPGSVTSLLNSLCSKLTSINPLEYKIHEDWDFFFFNLRSFKTDDTRSEHLKFYSTNDKFKDCKDFYKTEFRQEIMKQRKGKMW